MSEKSNGQYLGLICDESLTCRCLNLNPGYFCCFTFTFVSFGESYLLVSWCAGDRCDMVGSARIVVGVRDLVQRIGDD
jgi:hypothetical protein